MENAKLCLKNLEVDAMKVTFENFYIIILANAKDKIVLKHIFPF